MSLCEGGREFIASAKKNHFSTTLDTIMDQIRSYLFSGIHQPNPSREFNYLFRSGNEIRASKHIKVIELEEEDIIELTNNKYTSQLKGLYIPDLGKIFLNHQLWCLETFIHETLHSLSVSSSYSSNYRLYMQFFEGLTELYTGYLLRRHYDFCYNNCWKTCKESLCYCTYQREVKIWLGICHFVPLKYTFPLYFWDGEDRWESLWRVFIERIREYGYPRFEMIIDQDKKPKWLALHQEALKRFGREYLDIYNDIRNPLDLSLLLLE